MQAGSERATLRAILFADLQQYGRLSAANESEAVAFVTRCAKLFREHSQNFAAEFVKSTGDGVLLLFDSATNAIDYALAIQARICAMQENADRPRLFRIGIHMGEVHQHEGDVYGHAVNLASRIESQAEPGGICVTEEVYRTARPNARYEFRFGGRVALKNMPEAVSLFHVCAAVAPGAYDPAARLRVSVLDGISLSTELGDPVPIRSLSARGLVGCLALSHRSEEARDRIASLLWPDRNLREARRTLAACIRTIERTTGRHILHPILVRGTVVGLNDAAIEIDLRSMLDGLHKGRIHDVLLERSDWPAAILRGMEDIGPLFDAWLQVARHRWRAEICEALEACLVNLAVTEPALRRAAAALTLLEPTHERAAQYLIRHHLALGNISDARRVYDELRAVMWKRFSVIPSADTNALIGNRAAPSADMDAPGGPLGHRPAQLPSVSIGPFRMPMGNAGHAAAGFRAELIANLSKFRELTILELPSASGSSTSDYLVTAECVDAGSEMQLSVRLSEPGARRVIWSDSFILTLGNWFEAQRRLVAKVSSSLDLYLSQDRLSHTLPRPVADLAAYDAWLRGEHLLTRWSPNGDDEAAALFDYAIAKDPNFAPAYGSLASVHTSRHLIRPGTALDPEKLQTALQLAQRGVDIDPLDARAHLVVAWSTAMVGRFAQSEVHYELAAELNPNSPKTLISAALGMAFMGQTAVAMHLLGHAMALTGRYFPYQWSHIAAIRYLTDDPEGAVQAAERSNDQIVVTSGWKAAALRQLGRDEEARAALQRLHERVAAAWEGVAPPARAGVLDWFLSAFPLRREQDRARLAALIDPDARRGADPSGIG
jgi:class 3 adenylate cyclase/DNA-binding SARP family transcriptional activator/TolB-like protein